jgi:hypothetical protein
MITPEDEEALARYLAGQEEFINTTHVEAKYKCQRCKCPLKANYNYCYRCNCYLKVKARIAQQEIA